MSAVVLLVTLLAPAVLVHHWHRLTPVRAAHPRRARRRGRDAR